MSRAEHERAVLQALEPYGVRFLVMAGYMRIISSELLNAFRSERGYFRVVNVHPSLLPAFPGVNAYAQAFEHGAKVAGATVHLVDDGLDSGPICAQEAFRIDDCKSAEEVEQRGLAVEHRLYPAALNWILPENFGIEEMRTREGARRLRVHAN
jgi:phosphoribosylglycinamide formyltransferase-1